LGRRAVVDERADLGRAARAGRRYRRPRGCLATSGEARRQGHAARYHASPDTFDLPQLLQLAQSTNKGVEGAQANVDAATAAITSARAYPNPQVEVMYGRLSGKQPGVTSGNAPSYAIVQKLDYPNQRNLREQMAGRGLEASEAMRQGFRSDLAARVKTSYYQVLRRETELAAARRT
jgi:cobalt-zinc-cadmium efflux system outer membrane protein